MIQVLKKDYWSRADAFLLPLTGLDKDDRFEVKSYLFWNEYSIHNYNLILTFAGENHEELIPYCRKHIFPTLDRSGYLVECYDVAGRCIFVLDMSEWAEDIEIFIRGKYSKLSPTAIKAIKRFHKFNSKYIPIHIYAIIHPDKEMELLDGLSPIEYICQDYTYGLNIEDVRKLGEVGTLYDEMQETLITEITQICHSEI